MPRPKVTTEFEGQDNTTPVVKKITSNIKEMGEKISSIGMRMSAAITLPIVGMAVGLNKFGAESSQKLSDLNKAIGDANASQDPAKIKAAWVAWNGLSPAVREAGVAYDRLQEALRPVNAEFDKAKATLLTSLVPILKELTPTLISIATGIGNVARGFADLPQWEQNAILGFIGVAAAMGPVIVIAGQVISTVGTLQMLLPGLSTGIGTAATALKGFGAGAYAALGPVGALILAVITLIGLINGGQAAQAWNTLQQLVALGLRPLVGDQAFIKGSQNMGLVAPSPSGGGGGNLIVNYQPAISTASEDEATRMLAKLYPGVQRQLGR